MTMAQKFISCAERMVVCGGGGLVEVRVLWGGEETYVAVG